jgi:Cu-Zn family superoxide dismutase
VSFAGSIFYHPESKEDNEMKARTLSALTFSAAAALALSGCASSATAPAPAEGPRASATIEARSDSTATGTATFTELSTGGVRAHIHIEKAPPGTHGLHIHEKGDCSDPKAASAGGHFNPGGMPHSGPMDMKRHAGDLGNIEIKADGTGDLDITSDMLTVKPGPNSVVGRAVVFHEKADDLKTQPTGNAGGRFGCGVIQ